MLDRLIDQIYHDLMNSPSYCNLLISFFECRSLFQLLALQIIEPESCCDVVEHCIRDTLQLLIRKYFVNF